MTWRCREVTRIDQSAADKEEQRFKQFSGARGSAYRRVPPCREDIVLARYQGEMVIKRVVGLPHEEVELRHGQLYVNGLCVTERHLVQPGPLDIGKGMLCSGRFALLGDNRALTVSVVTYGVVGKEDIAGKVVFAVHWPKASSARAFFVAFN